MDPVFIQAIIGGAQLLAIVVLVPFITRISNNFDRLTVKIEKLTETVHKDFVRWEQLDRVYDRKPRSDRNDRDN